MEYKIEYLEEAEKELLKLPKKHIVQILHKIDILLFFYEIITDMTTTTQRGYLAQAGQVLLSTGKKVKSFFR